MITFKNIEEIQKADPFIVADIYACIYDSDKKLSFIDSVGGNVYLVETLEDLKEVKGAKGESVFDVVATFDAVELIGTQDQFMLFLNVNNTNGGPCYYVPKAVYEQCQNCMDSHDMNNGL